MPGLIISCALLLLAYFVGFFRRCGFLFGVATTFALYASVANAAYHCRTAMACSDMSQSICSYSTICTWVPDPVQPSPSPVTPSPITGGSGSTGGGSETLVAEQIPESEEKTDCPVVMATGEKLLTEVDFRDIGEMPLEVVRNYHSRHSYGGITAFSSYWSTDFDTKIRINYLDGNTCITAIGGTTAPGCDLYADSTSNAQIKNVTLIKNSTGEDFNGNPWGHLRPSVTKFSRRHIRRSGYDWIYEDAEGTQYKFSRRGRLLSKTNLHGISWTLTYGADNYLHKVTHSSGRALTFSWGNKHGSTGTKLVSAVTLPDSKIINYTYNLTGDRFTVTFPGGGGTKAYQKDSSFLSGIFIDGIQWSSYDFETPMSRVLYSGLVGDTNKSSFTFTSTSTVVTNAMSSQTTYNYDSHRRLIGISRPATSACPSAASVIQYLSSQPDSNIHYKEDWKGNRTSYTYNSNNDIQYEYSNGVTKEYAWDGFGRMISLKTWDGAKLSSLCAPNASCPSASATPRSETIYEYYTAASNNRLKSITVKDEAGNSTTTSYSYSFHSNKMINQKIVDGPRIDVSDIEYFYYNSIGALTSTTSGSGKTTTFAYTGNSGYPSSVTDPNGIVTGYEYDERYRLHKITLDKNGTSPLTTTYYYNGLDKVRRIEYPNGGYIQYEYDSAGRLYRKRLPHNLTEQFGERWTEYGYNKLSKLTSVKDYWKIHPDVCAPHCGSAPPTIITRRSYQYDNQGNLTADVGAGGRKWSYTYDANLNLETIKDGLGRTTSFTYTSDNQVESQTNPLNQTINYEYNEDLNLNAVIDARQKTTTITKNSVNQIVSYDSPDNGYTSYTHLANGLVKSFTNALGTTVTYAYDADNRLTGITTLPSSGENVSFAYGYQSSDCSYGVGRLCSVTDSSGSTHYHYTPLGKISSQQTTIMGVTQSVGYTYDTYGRLRSEQFDNLVQLRYSYNARNENNKIEAYLNGSWVTIISDTTPETPGYHTYTFGNGTQRQIQTHADGRIHRIRTFGIQDLTLTYSAAGEVTQILNAANTSATQDFTYDSASRLRTMTSTSGNESWTYDANGNRSTHTMKGITNTYGSTPTGNRITGISSPSAPESFQFSYDGAGNLTGFVNPNYSRTFEYDGLNRLRSVTHKSTRNAAETTEYRYNVFNQRVYKSRHAGTYRYLYNSRGQLIAETAANSNTLSTLYVYFRGQIIAIIRNNQVYAVHTDHLGRPEVITDSAKTIVWRAQNGPFDRTIILDKIGGMNIGLPGHYLDRETSYWNNWNRYYDGRSGRYLQADPTGLMGGSNPYVYALNNPVSFVDPFGLQPSSGDFWSAYLNYNDYAPHEVWETIGGSVGDTFGPLSNTCAARVSYGLNYGGEPITAGPGTNRNYGGDGKRYIVSAESLRDYLRDNWGSPDAILKSGEDLANLQSNLMDGQTAIVVNIGHAGVVTQTYRDQHVGKYLGEAWLLPVNSGQ